MNKQERERLNRIVEQIADGLEALLALAIADATKLPKPATKKTKARRCKGT